MWGFLGWLDDHSASSSESGRDLSSYHGSREIPWGDNATDANRLLDGEDCSMGHRGRDHIAIGAGCFFGEPGDEVRGVNYLAFRFSYSFAIF